MSMSVTDYVGGSCAAASISNLGAHKNAFDATVELFKATLGMPSANRYGTSDAPKFKLMNSHYIFIAGPEAKPGEGGRSHHSKAWVSYGTEFAQYLLDHRLGTVATAGQILNAKYHPTTTCQVWIFQPNQNACEQWWTTASADLVAYQAQVKAVRVAQEAAIKALLAKDPSHTPFPLLYHYGYSPADGETAGQALGQLITIHTTSYDYAYYKTANDENRYTARRTRELTPRDLPLGNYLITKADHTFWELTPVPEGVTLDIPKAPVFMLREPAMKTHIPTPPAHGLMKKRRWKYIIDANGVKKRQYFWAEVEGLAGAYSINATKEPLEVQGPVEVPPNEQSPIAEVTL